jgi:hypothetical protein
VPLWILAAYLNFALPLAIASLSLTLGVCGFAALQAPLPKAQCRFWSRPLIAALFFLQPIVRGWARFALRLKVPASSRDAKVQKEFLARPTELPAVVSFWTRGSTDRCRLLDALLKRLEARRWPVRPDSGWDNFDFEVPRSRWSRLSLTTVSEELEQARRTIRCRMRGCWSFMAWLVFGHMLGLLALVLALFAAACPWLWLSLVLVPLLHWYFDDDRQCLHQEILGAIEETARDLELVKLPAEAPSPW